MNNTLSKIVIFAAGTMVGSLAAWTLAKRHYEQITRDEIESIRELYAGDTNDCDESVEDDETDVDSNDGEYDNIIKSNKYMMDESDDEEEDESDDEEEEEEEGEEMVEPYVIRPDEFDENGYETVSLYYNEKTGVVTDVISGKVIENVSELIGRHALETFGQYEDDSVFVRNENIRTDFEILKDGE